MNLSGDLGAAKAERGRQQEARVFARQEAEKFKAGLAARKFARQQPSA